MSALLTGKNAVVTGGLRGIGSATVGCLRDQGARVVVIDRDAPDESSPHDYLQADVTDRQAVCDAIATAAQPTGLDICVANAGVTEFVPTLEASPEHWRRILEVNVMGTVYTLTAAAQWMVKAGRGGRLVATASVAGLRGEAGGAAYCASKAAVISLCQSMALEFASEEINVNAVAPGEIDTELHAGLMRQMATHRGESVETIRQTLIEQRVPAGRMGTPSDVAAVIAFLVGPNAAYITGETMRIDGGELLS